MNFQLLTDRFIFGRPKCSRFLWLGLLASIVLLSFAQYSLGQDIDDEQHRLNMQAALDSADHFLLEGEFAYAAEKIEIVLPWLDQLERSLQSQLFLTKFRLEFAKDRPEIAQPWLERLAKVAPETLLDPLRDPPLAMASWAETRQRVLDRQQVVLQRDEKRLSQERRSSLRFALTAMPFGIGHFDAGKYEQAAQYLLLDALSVYTFSLLKGGEPLSPGLKDHQRDGKMPLITASSLLVTSWGMQLLSLGPVFQTYNFERSEAVRSSLSFVPFGVGQLKNGQDHKAAFFATLHSGLLGYAVFVSDQRKQRLATNLLAASFVYSAVDGWIYHEELSPQGVSDSRVSLRLSVVPKFNGIEAYEAEGVKVKNGLNYYLQATILVGF